MNDNYKRSIFFIFIIGLLAFAYLTTTSKEVSGIITNQETTRSVEICADVKSFLSSYAVQGKILNEIPEQTITTFINSEATKFGLPTTLINDFVYSYKTKCNASYPSPAWLSIRNNWVILALGLLVLFVTYQGIKRM